MREAVGLLGLNAPTFRISHRCPERWVVWVSQRTTATRTLRRAVCRGARIAPGFCDRRQTRLTSVQPSTTDAFPFESVRLTTAPASTLINFRTAPAVRLRLRAGFVGRLRTRIFTHTFS